MTPPNAYPDIPKPLCDECADTCVVIDEYPLSGLANDPRTEMGPCECRSCPRCAECHERVSGGLEPFVAEIDGELLYLCADCIDAWIGSPPFMPALDGYAETRLRVMMQVMTRYLDTDQPDERGHALDSEMVELLIAAAQQFEAHANHYVAELRRAAARRKLASTPPQPEHARPMGVAKEAS